MLGQKFVVISDQKALKFLLEQREVQPQFQKWLVKLLGYEFKILYQLGLNKKAANALSRIPPRVELRILPPPALLDISVMQKKVEANKVLQEIVERLKQDPSNVPKFSCEHGRLLYKGRLVLSSSSSLIPSLLQTYHDSMMGGHSGYI